MGPDCTAGASGRNARDQHRPGIETAASQTIEWACPGNWAMLRITCIMRSWLTEPSQEQIGGARLIRPDVQVAAGRRYRGMAKRGLDQVQRRSVIERVRTMRMPQP